MADRKNQRTVVAATAPTETEGALIVGRLGNAGIKAHLIGGLTSAFRAKAPSEVKIVVLEEDAQRAMEVLQEKE